MSIDGNGLIQFITPGISTPEDDYKPPNYRDIGRILVRVSADVDGFTTYNHEYEVIDYDGDSCVFWINEGEGFDYWLDQIEFKDGPGIYLIESITGDYIRGDGHSTDDDVHWDHDPPRKVRWWWRLWQKINRREMP